MLWKIVHFSPGSTNVRLYMHRGQIAFFSSFLCKSHSSEHLLLPLEVHFIRAQEQLPSSNFTAMKYNESAGDKVESTYTEMRGSKQTA